VAAQGNKKGRAEKASFSVDTQVFRELGELLVGRDATALLELVKNAYDADATFVRVHGERVDSVKRGSIVVSDDGNGMTVAQFRKGFLRLAGRGKGGADRRSPRYGRRYTGEKGVGRLATHKLARLLEVQSVPHSAAKQRPRGLRAEINWTGLERRSDLARPGNALSLRSYTPGPDEAHGTEISLSRLRHAWTAKDLGEFTANIDAFSPPPSLVSAKRLRELLKPDKLLFAHPLVRDQQSGETDPGFAVELTGDFEIGGEHWDELVESVEWVVEIDARKSGVTYCMAPTKRERKKTKQEARKQTLRIKHPSPRNGPFFQARILARSRGRGDDSFKGWSESVAGIRVYSEGFRVLPYGSRENDWLEINRDYVARSRELTERSRQAAEELGLGEDRDLGLTGLPSDSYVGAIFLTRESSGDLEMLVNREGFVPNSAFENLQALTRLGVDLLTRARAAGRQTIREEAKRRREARRTTATEGSGLDSEAEEPDAPSVRDEVDESLGNTRAEIAQLRTQIAAGDTHGAERRIEVLEQESKRLASAVDSLVAEQRLYPILATVGIQMGEFVHEINGLLAMTIATDTVLGRLRQDPDNFASAEVRRELAESHGIVHDLRARLERQAAYLIDLTGPTAVRRRSRQPLAQRIDRAAELIRPALERQQISFSNRVGQDVRTPAMFPAELTAVLLNLLTNATKAAGKGGRILVATRQGGSGVRLRIDNTGVLVDLDDGERWFRPFETTTTEVDPLLGQGMGFGLPITRGILEEYGASIAFVPPRKGYATAVQVDFPR
jgi:signal transduction histidine kinase